MIILKNETTEFVKECYDENEFDMNDVVGISRGTTKQDDLFEYVEAPDYLKSKIKDYDNHKKIKMILKWKFRCIRRLI